MSGILDIAGALPLGGITTGLFNAAQNKKQRRYEERMYNRQLSDQWSFWNANNEYNSPLKQKQRLQSAGINPLLPFLKGGMASAGTASGGSAPSASISRPTPFNFSGVNSVIDKIYDLKLKSKGISKLDEDIQSAKIANSRSFLEYLNEKLYSAKNAKNESEIKRYERWIKDMEAQTLDEQRGGMNAGNIHYKDGKIIHGDQDNLNYGQLKNLGEINNINNTQQATDFITANTQGKHMTNKRLEELDELMKQLDGTGPLSEIIKSALWFIFSR